MMMMELQLGLAFPTNAATTTTTTKGLDLNSYVYDLKESTGSSGRRFNQHCTTLQLGSYPWLSTSNGDDDDDDITSTATNHNNKKRSFSDAFKDVRNDVVFGGLPTTLPLLLWNLQPNEDDDPKDSDNTSFAFNKVDEDCDGIVGWPPIKFRRKRTCHRRKLDNNRTVDNGCIDCHGRRSNSTYVKVKMEGVAIARKIDISLYNSFQPLKRTLLAMFGIYPENSNNYELTYQDREGDWLLADDEKFYSVSPTSEIDEKQWVTGTTWQFFLVWMVKFCVMFLALVKL